MDQRERLLFYLKNLRNRSPEDIADTLLLYGVLAPQVGIGQVVYHVNRDRYVSPYRIFCIHCLNGKEFRYYGSSEDGGLPVTFGFNDDQIGKNWFTDPKEAHDELERRRQCKQ